MIPHMLNLKIEYSVTVDFGWSLMCIQNYFFIPQKNRNFTEQYIALNVWGNSIVYCIHISC